MELFAVGLILVAAVLLVIRRLWRGATGRTDLPCDSCSACARENKHAEADGSSSSDDDRCAPGETGR